MATAAPKPVIHYVTQNGIGNAWVASELQRVEAAGLPVVLHAMRAPEILFHKSAWALSLHQRTRVIYPLNARRLIAAILAGPVLFGRNYFAALANALFGRREHWRARIAGLAHFAVACVWASEVRSTPDESVAHVHSQWINSCGTIAMYGAWLLGRPFSFTGHATDLFRNRCALLDKIERAEFIVCISEFHRRFYLDNGARPEQLFIVYCGIDPSLFYPPAAAGRPQRPFRILSTGRLVEKKGFDVLVRACRLLVDRGEDFECVIGGNGPLEGALRAEIERLQLSGRVTVTGKVLLQEDIVRFMHSGDVYALPCVWAADGDVDGLPQMLMEAMACGLPAVSTRLVGIPDLVRHEETGLLVAPGSAAELADALSQLMHDRALAGRLAACGRDLVLKRFNLKDCAEPLLDRYRRRLGMPAAAPPEFAATA